MKLKPIIRRALAEQDVLEAALYYLEQDAAQAALDFVDELEVALNHIQHHPGTGSARYAHTLNLPGLRFWSCNKFPYVVFYFEQEDCIDVWRVLHGKRDIPVCLQDDAAGLNQSP
ncbi:MAG: type II toxin-antitoxin system RelE/ParE family toxin [Brachymonas sp.]|nr:type II toxin-antitoxin system RelE/ParE family toxin [Brachymonas sp.]